MKVILGALLVSVTLAATPASAQTPASFGGKGSLVLSAERLFGYDYSTNSGFLTGNQSSSTTTFSLVTSPFGVVTSNFGFARLAFDGFVTDTLSLGGAVSYFSSSVTQGGRTTDLSGVLVAPRIGFAVGFSRVVSLWGRGGISYLSVETTATKTSLFALTLEAPLVFSLSEHFALTLGPTLDVGLSGTRTTTVGPVSTSTDVKGNDFGVQFGMMGSF
jgi:hypothetical protein